MAALLAIASTHFAAHGKSKAEPKVYLAPLAKVYHQRGCLALKHLKTPEAVTPKDVRKRGRRECFYCFPDHPMTAKARK